MGRRWDKLTAHGKRAAITSSHGRHVHMLTTLGSGFRQSEGMTGRNDIKLFFGVVIDLIILHDWVLGLDYQSI